MQVSFTSDLYFLKNSKKLIQNAHFVVVFLLFFEHALLRPKCDAPIYGQVKGPIDIHNRGKFYDYSICCCQVISFQMLSDDQNGRF